MDVPRFASIQEVGELIRSRALSPVAVVESCLAQIERLNGRLNAFISVQSAQAREQAAHLEAEVQAGRWRGPLHGIPIGVKDMFDTAQIPTTAAFEYFANRIPTQDAAAVARLKDCGAIIIGKTNLHTLAMGTTSLVSHFGPVRNPWNVDYIAGGSSGGSAAAVASGMCFATLDTDAIGSTRLPAACCGVVGYKCTWGLIDNSGVLEGEETDPVILKLATVGITARHVWDVAQVAEALAGASETQALAARPQDLRIAVATNAVADPGARQRVGEAVNVLRTLNYTVMDGIAPISESPDMAGLENARQTLSPTIFGDADILVLPTLASRVLEAQGIAADAQALSPQNTFFANYFGLPAVSVPCGFDGHGLPIGMQFVGKPNSDGQLFRVAQAYQRATPWHAQHPPV